MKHQGYFEYQISSRTFVNQVYRTSNCKTMRLVLDIEESKVDFMLDLLKEFSFVKASKIYDEPEDDVKSFKEAVEEFNLIRQGKSKGRPAQELLDEL